MTIISPPSTPAQGDAILSLLRKVERAGGNSEIVLRRAGVPFDQADLAEGRVRQASRADLSAIYREVIVAIGWHSSRLDRRPQMTPDEFRLMCYCIISCRTFRDVIERQILFFETRGVQRSRMSLTVDGPVATLTMDNLRRRKSFSTFLSDLAGLSILSRLYAWLLGIGTDIFRCQLAYGDPYAAEPIADFFNGELRFHGETTAIAFPASLLDAYQLRGPEQLDRLLVHFPFDFLATEPQAAILPDRIRAIYASRLSQDLALPTLGELARMTGQSASTLRRRLATDGLSLGRLKAAARRDVVMILLGQRHRSIADIAYSAGFRDVNSFRAAFRGWTGATPSAFRRSMVGRREGTASLDGPSSGAAIAS
ncbi:MAG: AraC family transcriptional regulator ligand-binding domain-containing protein [Pseudomonadota bacterium]